MVKQSLINTFINEIYSKTPKKNYETNKTLLKSIDETWSADLLQMDDYGVENNKGYKYILTVIDNFSKFGWTVPLKNKFAKTVIEAFSNIINNSKRKPKLLETDDGKDFTNKMFIEFLKLNDIKRYSRYTSKGAVFAERFSRTIRDLLKKPVFEKGNANWIDELQSITNKYNNKIHSSTKMTPIEASKKSNESEVYTSVQDKRKKRKPKYNIGDLVRTADKRNTFSKGDSTNWSNKLYTITEIIDDTIPSYRIDNFPERYNEALLKKSKLTYDENEVVMQKLKIYFK